MAPGSLDYDDDGTSQTNAPLFANANTGDFHQLPNSPTVNAGLDDPANGSFDIDGDTRTIPTQTDIGADEYAPAPSAVTGSATGVGPTGATPEGTANPNGAATAAHFEWGPTASYGNSTADQALAASTSPSVVSSALGGLAPSTTYHFRLVATSHAGTALGADQTFTTAAAPVPGSGGPSGPGSTGDPVTPAQVLPDTLAPVVGSFRLTNRTFAVGPGATPLKARAKRGSAFRFSLSEAATVSIRIDRSVPGVRKGKRCVKPTKGAKGKRCKRFVKAGTLKRSAVAGPNTVAFSGRLGTRALKPGSYRAVVTGTDAAGNRSEAATAAFKIVRR